MLRGDRRHSTGRSHRLALPLNNKVHMKGVIIYQGRYGATAQYARWLAESLGFPVLPAENVTPPILASYDLVVAGSSVYVGRLLLAKWLDRQAAELAGKKVLLFVVCGTTADDPEQQRQLISYNIGPALRKAIKLFFLPGRCDISKLSWKDQIILKMGAWLQKDPQKKALMNQGFDRMDQKYLAPLIAAALSRSREESASST